MALPYTVVDVFTKTPFKGNPLAIVTIPVGAALTQHQKQTITKEFNLSETVFVHDVEDPSSTAERRFDIFTPQAELPFAGHPTIGTAVFLYSQGVRTLISKAGPIKIEQGEGSALLASIPHNVRLHAKRIPHPEEVTLRMLEKGIAMAEKDAPLFSIVNGMTFALIEVPSLEILGTTRIGVPELSADLLDEGWRERWVTRRYYFFRLGTEQRGGRTVQKIRTRLTKLTTEDAATGSAACALASYLSLHVLGGMSAMFEITQGVEMGRESKMHVEVALSNGPDGERKIQSVHLGGEAVPVMSGNLSVRP